MKSSVIQLIANKTSIIKTLIKKRISINNYRDYIKDNNIFKRKDVNKIVIFNKWITDNDYDDYVDASSINNQLNYKVKIN